MAKVIVSCPKCLKAYRADETLLGKKFRCKQCEATFVLAPPEKQGSAASPVAAAIGTPGNSHAGAETDVPLHWQAGDVILNQYEVKEAFTGGGMGLVYRVRHRQWNVDLAVKCPRPEWFRTERQKENFEREAETWVNLNLHPHTVHCYYVRRLGGVPRVFAEYVDGGTLAEWIHGVDGQLPRLYQGGPEQALARILDIAIQFAWGLHFAHENRLIHQDVKPANVLMTPDGTAKVTDFGLARARASSAETREVGGSQTLLATVGGMTPRYCSPEQANRQTLTRQTDLWSWAVSLLEMFNGEATWPSGSIADKALQSYLKRGPAEDHLPRMPPSIAEVLGRCLQPDSTARPRDMREVIPSLKAFYQQATGQTYPRAEPQMAKALAPSLNNRAMSFLDLGWQAKAEKTWESTLQAVPNHPTTLYNLGLVQWRSASLSDAGLLKSLKEGGSTYPDQAWVRYLQALVHLERGDCTSILDLLPEHGKGDFLQEEVDALRGQAQEHLSNSRRLVRTFEGHTNSVISVALSEDGHWAVSSSYDNTTKLWGVNGDRYLNLSQKDDNPVYRVVLSADGRLAAGGHLNSVRVWEVSSGRCVITLEGHTKSVIGVALSPDGSWALSCSMDQTLKLWDVSHRRCLRTFQDTKEVTAVVLSRDGRRALSASWDGTFKHWDVNTGHCLNTFGRNCTSSMQTAIALFDDGRRALTEDYPSNDLKLWDLSSNRCLQTFRGHTGKVNSVAISSDGRWAVSGSDDRTVRFWEVSSGRCLHSFEGHKDGVNAVALSADGRWALSGSADKSAKVWHVAPDWSERTVLVLDRVQETGSLLRTRQSYERLVQQTESAIQANAFSQAAHLVRQARTLPGYENALEAVAYWGRLYRHLPRREFRTAQRWRTFRGHTGSVHAVALSADGRLALSGSADKTLKLWDLSNGACLRTFEGHSLDVHAAALSADGRLALSGSEDTTIKLWDVDSSRCLRTFEGHTKYVTTIAMFPHGRWALSGSADKTLRLWDVLSGKCLRVFEGHTVSVCGLALSGDGCWAWSGGGDYNFERYTFVAELRSWELASGRSPNPVYWRKPCETAVALSADGRQGLSAGDDSLVRLWETSSGRCQSLFEGHTGSVKAVALSSDAHWALSGGADRTVKFWDARTGHCLRTCEGHTDTVKAVSLSRDCRWALSGSYDGSLILWFLDWELGNVPPEDWNEDARSVLEVFLSSHTPYLADSPGPGATENEITSALTRRGKPAWSDSDFQRLLDALGCAGFGWLRPEVVRRELHQMAAAWQGPPPLA